MPEGMRAVIIGDREADICELFVQSAGDPLDLLVRNARNRRGEWNGVETRLRDTLNASPVLETFVMDSWMGREKKASRFAQRP